jgi:hypothetical protein
VPVGLDRLLRQTTQEGLIGFDWGRLSQEKRVEKPTSSRKRSLENTVANSNRNDFALAA